MLILTRRVGKRIVIGDDVRVIVLEVTDTHVRLGIEAPDQVGVYREEIYQRVRRQEHEVDV